MYCKNCGNQVDANAAACLNCGFDPKRGSKFCMNCGKPVNENQAICLGCGYQISNNNSFSNNGSSFMNDFKRVANGKILAGVCTGLGKYWNITPWAIRLAFVFLPVWPVWLVIYIILANKPFE